MNFESKNMNSISEIDKKYETTEKILKFILRFFALILWLGGVGLLVLPYLFIGAIIYAYITATKLQLMDPFALLLILIIALITYGWFCFGKFLRGDRSCRIPVKIAERLAIYSPENLLRRLRNNRNNVVVLKSKQWQIRIFGSGEARILEILMGTKDEMRYFHLTNADPESIVPVTDNAPVVIGNKWHERFPVRNNWIVDDGKIEAFLTKLYSFDELEFVMEGFVFEDSTEEVNKLIDADAYIVPKIPVDRPVGGSKSDLGQSWLRRKEVRLQRALNIMEKV